MWKSGVLALVAASVFSPCFAQQADPFDDGMQTLWEVLWHQSGTATRLVRWEQDIKVRVYGVHAAQHRAHTLQALHAAADIAGVKVIDVTDAPDAASQANVSIEITPDNALDDSQPCETRLNFASETRIDSVTMQMRDGEERRCAYHESMHVMGVRGHPGGDTVLSYFASQVEGLQPLDKVMLRAWYSPRAQGGMTPFEVLPILADELVAIMPDQGKAQQQRDRFLARTVDQMQAFADGKGDIPTIVKECGKSSAEGIRFGRMEMGYFLGLAYREGVSVKQDPALAARWLQRAATLGSRSAQSLLGAGAGTVKATPQN
jgi:hypothetical protein